MTILIVEDDADCRRMLAEMAQVMGESAGIPIHTLQAADRETAMTLALQADAILCDGTFPTGGIRPVWSPDDHGTRRDNWMHLWGRALKRRIAFVLLSGDLDLVLAARKLGVRAFAKPEGAKEAIEALLNSSDGSADLQIRGAFFNEPQS